MICSKQYFNVTSHITELNVTIVIMYKKKTPTTDISVNDVTL